MGWGSAYFVARWSTRTVGAVRTVYYTHVVGFILLGAYLLLSGELQNALQNVGWIVWLWLVLATTCNTLSALATYRAIQVGVLSLVVPISASYAVFTVILSLLSGEAINVLQAIGIVAAIGGVALATMSTSQNDDGDSLPGIIWALISALGYGVTYWLLGFKVTADLGGIIPAWVMRVNSLLLLTAFTTMSYQRTRLTFPTRSAWWFIVGVGVLESAGSIF